MKSTFNKFIAGVLIASFIAFLFVGINGEVQAQDSFPPALDPVLSADGLTLSNGVPPLVIMADPSPAKQNIKPVGPTAADLPASAGSENASFSITYIPAGSYDFYGTLCYAFPASAKTAFNAAANIWAVKLQSSVPITIKACWADLSFWPGVLGYSGGQESYRDFAGAPKPGTWYESSLANSLHGSDLDATKADINITYHKDWPWYYGTNGLPPAGTYDLVSVAAHEIAHGLNFSGTADYSGGTGSVGDGGYPNIYDTFMENGAGTALTSLPNPSTQLGDLLTSGDLWFDGPNSYAANGNVRVKIFAPASWMGGSSYSHLDYDTFSGTANSLMVYAIGSGSAQHNPGPVTLGLFKDLGWQPATAPVTPTPISPAGATADTTPKYKWTRVATATQYRYQLLKGTTLVYTKLVGASVCGTSYCASTPSNVLTLGSYKWRVQAYVGGVWKPYSAFKAFSITFTPTPMAPSGTITDTTPTYQWTRLIGASQYRYQLLKGTTLVYTKIVGSTRCGTTYCTSTPSTVLSAGSYKWRVQAYVGGVWRAYSAYKAFSIAAPSNKPKAGLWKGMNGAVQFNVLSTQNYVDDFTVKISVSGCGYYTIKHDSPLVPIVNNLFSFSGSYWANGKFNTTTTVSGQVGFNKFYLPGCGYISGTLPYTAAWYSAGQPLVATPDTGQPLDVVAPADQNGNGFWILEKDSPAP